MATWKQVILKDPITGEYLAPLGGNFSGGDADTLQSHPASDFLLKTEYTPVDLSEYLKTATADTKYAAVDHNHNGVYAPVSHTHTTGQISDLGTVLAGYAPASHTHTTSNITGLDTKLSGYDSEIASLKSSVSNGKSAVASAITDKGVSTSATAPFEQMAANIRSIPLGGLVRTFKYTPYTPLTIPALGFLPLLLIVLQDRTDNLSTKNTMTVYTVIINYYAKRYLYYTTSSLAFGAYGADGANFDNMAASSSLFNQTAMRDSGAVYNFNPSGDFSEGTQTIYIFG